MSSKLALNSRQNTQVQCRCRTCRRDTKHDVLVDAMVSGESGNHNQGYVNWRTEYQVVRCRGCETIGFRYADGNQQDCLVQIGEDEWDYQPLEHLYPSPELGRNPLADVDILPEKVSRIYSETIKSLNQSHEVLCGIGVRAIIENVCKDKQATGKDLYEKINSLLGIGVLTKDGAAILHKLRTLGNKAAHEVQPHTKKELGLALDVVDHLLLGVYILPEQAKKTFK